MVIKGDKDRCRIRDDQYGLGGHCWLSFKTTDTPVFFSFDQLLQQFSSHSNWKINFNSVQASISPFIFKSQKAALSKKDHERFREFCRRTKSSLFRISERRQPFCYSFSVTTQPQFLATTPPGSSLYSDKNLLNWATLNFYYAAQHKQE